MTSIRILESQDHPIPDSLEGDTPVHVKGGAHWPIPSREESGSGSGSGSSPGPHHEALPAPRPQKQHHVAIAESPREVTSRLCIEEAPAAHAVDAIHQARDDNLIIWAFVEVLVIPPSPYPLSSIQCPHFLYCCSQPRAIMRGAHCMPSTRLRCWSSRVSIRRRGFKCSRIR